MNDEDMQNALATRLMTMRIIFFALMNAIVVFLAIALYLRASGQGQAAPDPPLLTYLAVALGGLLFVAHVVVPRAIAAASMRRIARGQAITKRPADSDLGGEVGQLVVVYQQRLIVSAALLEAPAILALIAYIVEGLWPALLVVGISLLALATRFPTMYGLQTWLEESQERIASERAES
jgi:hypothetical protein